jgi:MinD superfamily P-loop ATPase
MEGTLSGNAGYDLGENQAGGTHEMKQLIVLSGKGGTGKTSIVAALATLAKGIVVADCDVDAADLHLILTPEVNRIEDFHGSKVAVLDREKCTQCDECRQACRSDAIGEDLTIDVFRCEGCGLCAYLCPTSAIELKPRLSGHFYTSSTRMGPMAHAALDPGEGNTGKLVSKVRQTAQDLSEQNGRELIIIDGSPGIGCPVIASLTGANAVLVVIEPTLSGIHDLERVLALARHFCIRSYICINKFDLNEAMSQRIEKYGEENGSEIVGRIPYSDDVTEAMIQAKSIIEYRDGPVADEIKNMWEKLSRSLGISQSAH